MTSSSSGAELLGRRTECQALDELLVGARAGRSAAVALRGEAGIGKTELLSYLQGRATGCRIVSVAGVQSEMELSYAGLHQLCAPLLTGGLDHLPEPQCKALSIAFGLRGGDVPDRFLVGLATLSLLADAGGDTPLVCLIDDAQWLDHASVLTLEFVARRLLAESVVLVFAVRVPSLGETLAGLPDLLVTGLNDRDSRTLLDTVVTGPLDERVRERILAESRGNPLALLELPRGWTAAEMADFGGLDARPLAGEIEQGFLRRLESLPAETQRLLVAAAAEPVGDVTLLRHAAKGLGISVDAAVADAEASELITVGARVRFRHPLARSAVYRAASPPERQEAHRALAESIDPDVDPDRRAWHRAHAAAGPDEDVAVELERSAERTQARGGIAAVAAFLERAAELTQDPARRAQRALDAAQAKLHAGAFEPAAALLAMAEAGPPDELRLARTDLLNAQIAFVQSRGNEATPLLLAAARRLEQLDVGLARGTYLEAVAAAVFAGRLARGPGLREVGAAARSAPPSKVPGLPDKLLDALAVRLTDGFSAAAPMMKRALGAVCDEELPVREALRWVWLGSVIGADLWDEECWETVATRHLTIIREAGALSELPNALDSRATVHLICGELAAATSLVEEARMVCEATGTIQARLTPLGLAAMRGHEHEARELLDSTMSEAVPRGQGAAVTVAHWYHALLCNGLGQYDEALVAAQLAARHPEEFASPRWGLVELVEAAARSGAPELASDALERLSATLRASGTDWALGVEARSRALLSQGVAAERLYLEAIERLGRTRVRVDLARARLLYGEWLRSENRHLDAREQLGMAHEMLTQIGAEGFAERARRELQATGAKVRKRPIATHTALTPQEAQIARLAADGLTNPEIGAQLFLSRHTVDWHLRKVFSKLGIGSRKEIHTVLPQDAST